MTEFDILSLVISCFAAAVALLALSVNFVRFFEEIILADWKSIGEFVGGGISMLIGLFMLLWMFVTANLILVRIAASGDVENPEELAEQFFEIFCAWPNILFALFAVVLPIFVGGVRWRTLVLRKRREHEMID